MKNIFSILAMLSLAFATSCGTQKAAAPAAAPIGEVEISIPCSGPEFFSNETFVRASAMGFSANMEVASQKAQMDARTKLAAAVETLIKSTTDRYVSSHESGMADETVGKYQSLAQSVVQQTLSNSRVICQKTTQTADGQYRCYIAMELAGENVLKQTVNTISNDTKLRTDFEYEKYKKQHEAAMAAQQ